MKDLSNKKTANAVFFIIRISLIANKTSMTLGQASC